MRSYISHLECSKTGDIYSASEVHNLSKDGMPLLARYDLERLKAEQNKDTRYGFYRFIQEPPSRDISSGTIYLDQRTNINTNIHLMTTQCFLDNQERTLWFHIVPCVYFISIN